MTVFDQRGQTVGWQYNAAGNINFGAVSNRAAFHEELRKLEAEVASAISANAIEGEIAVDVEHAMKKAVIQAEKPEPEKSALVEYLTRAKDLVAGVSGLAGAFSAAIKQVQSLF